MKFEILNFGLSLNKSWNLGFGKRFHCVRKLECWTVFKEILKSWILSCLYKKSWNFEILNIESALFVFETLEVELFLKEFLNILNLEVSFKKSWNLEILNLGNAFIVLKSWMLNCFYRSWDKRDIEILKLWILKPHSLFMKSWMLNCIPNEC